MSETERAAQAVESLNVGEASQKADEMATAFEAAGERIARSLDRAAKSGELSFNSLAESVLKDLARLAVSDLIEAPLSQLVEGLGKNLTQGLSGAGPSANVTLNILGASNPDGFRQSEGQIAASLARAVSLGQRRI